MVGAVRHPAGETITVTRKGVPTGADDEQGNPVIGPDTTFDIDYVALAPSAGVSGAGASDETAAAYGAVVVTGFTLFLPYGTVLHASDRITIRGVEGWQVEGDTEATGWRNPFNGLTPGSVVSVRRAV